MPLTFFHVLLLCYRTIYRSELGPHSSSSEILGYSCSDYLGRPFLERKQMGVNELLAEISLVGRMLIELVCT
jgi:hypothetical protein